MKMKMKRKFFVRYPRNFGNEYTLVYTNNDHDAEQATAEGYERITSEHARALARRSRRADRVGEQWYGSRHVYRYGSYEWDDYIY